MGKNQHVVKVPSGGWGVKSEGNKRNTKNFDTQIKAFEEARRIAINEKSEVLIHGIDGKIRDRNSYGNDPYPPKG